MSAPLGALAWAAAPAARALDVNLAAPVGRTVAALVARAAAALGLPTPSPLRAVLLLVAVGATLTGLAALLPLARRDRRSALAATARRAMRRATRRLRIRIARPLRAVGRAVGHAVGRAVAARVASRVASRVAAIRPLAPRPTAGRRPGGRAVGPAAADARTLAGRGAPVAEIARRTGLARDAIAIARHLAG